MSDYEPAAGANLPPGCMDVPDTSMGDTCGECKRAVWFGTAHIVCSRHVVCRFYIEPINDPEMVLRWAADSMMPATTEACEHFDPE